jgi:hypothetical protein
MHEYSIGPLTGLLKPKYRVINTILGENYFPDKGLDIFIDLNTLISTMSSCQKLMMSLPFSTNVEKDFIEHILKTYKHWKDFSRKWGDKVRIFMIFNDFKMNENIPERNQLKSYLLPYENKYKNDKFTQLVYYWNESINIVEPLMQYLPQGYLIRCNQLDSFIVPQIIHDYDTNPRDRLIISGSPMMTNYSFIDNTRVVYTCYRRQGTLQLSDPLMISQTLTKIDDNVMEAFIKNKVFYNLLNTIIGDKDRGIIGITQFGITTFATDLLRSIEKREIPVDPKSINTVLNVVTESYHEYLKKNYPLMDVELHAQMIPESVIQDVRSKIIDKSDIDALSQFKINDLNLLELI